MATKQIGPIQFQGKLGTIVGRSTRKGYMSLGMKATKVTNPQTQKQVTQRVKFACAQEYSNGIPIDCFAGLRPYARSLKASVRNAANKLCFDKGIMQTNTTSTGVRAQINTADFFFSEGNEPGAYFGTVSTATPERVDVSANVMVHKSGIVHFIVYQQDVHTFIHVTKTFPGVNTSTNDDIEAQIKVPSAWNGMKVYVFAYVQYLPEDISVDYYSSFAAAHSEEREAIESRSTYSPTHLVGEGNIS